MLPRPPSVFDDVEQVPVPPGLQRIVAFSVHMRCDGTQPGNIVRVSKQSVERGLRPPTAPDEVQNLAEGSVLLELCYGFDMEDDRLGRRIDNQTVLGAWVTEQGEPQVYRVRLTYLNTFRDGGTTQYRVEIEHPKKPGRYVLLRNAVGDKVVTLTIVFSQD